MKLQKVFEKLSDLADQQKVPKGVLDEGRIFSLGVFENEEHLHGRVTEVVEGLKDHVGQPFDLHPWAYTFQVSTLKQDGVVAPMTLVGVVWPQANGSILVRDFIALPNGLRHMNHFLFHHTSSGTRITIPKVDGSHSGHLDQAASSLYPLAIAVLNTRGCGIDLKRAPSVKNTRRKRQGKHLIPAHYDVDAAEYFSALRSAKESADKGGTHASPIPHLRRAHERVLQNGKRIWVMAALINVRHEGDVAFVERRKAYRRGAEQQ